MQRVPYYEKMKDKSDLSGGQMLTLVILIYVTSFLFFCELIIALYNFFAFLIK